MTYVNGIKQREAFRDLRCVPKHSSNKLSLEMVFKYKWKHRLLPTFTSPPAALDRLRGQKRQTQMLAAVMSQFIDTESLISY